MKPDRFRLIHKALLWFGVIAFSLAWGYSAALAESDDEANLTGIAVSGPASVNESSSAVFTATATFSDGTKRDVTARATWRENSDYATISGGVLKTRSVSRNRTLTITARYTYREVTRSAQLPVTILNGGSTSVTLTGVTVTGTGSITEGTTSPYKATAAFSNGTTQDVTTTAAWSENSAYTTISAAGVLTAGQVTGNQSVTVTASYSVNGVSRSGSLPVSIVDVVTPPPAVTLQSISIGGPASVNEGTTTGFPVTATMSNGSTKSVVAAMTENSAYASFSGSNLTTTAVTGNQIVMLSASYAEGGVTRTASKTVSIVDSNQPPVLSGSHADRIALYEGTKTCLQCHRSQAVEVHNSEHYQWAGKFGKINDFCIYPDINHIGKLTNVNGQEVDGGCSKCHVGKGAKPAPVTANPTDAQLENIDCLICHAPQYKRTVDPVTKTQWVPDETAMGVTILEAAVDIQKPSRATCLNCHTKSGGGDNFKRGDIEEHHRNPATRAFDVHMSSASLGGADLNCTACHAVTNHKIAGKGVDLRVQEGTKPDCITCHTAAPPHSNSNINSRHVKRVACTTCHIPTFAKKAPTDVFRDWSAPGELNTATGLYDPARTMQANVVPQYKFWDGKSSVFYNFGTAFTTQSNGNALMAGPVAATQATVGAKIHPFKVHTALQPYDTVTNYLLPLKIGQFYTQGDLVNAIPLGQDGVGWPRNPYDYQSTERWMGLFHEVSPKENAVGYNNCNACHNTSTPKVPLKSLGYTIKAGQTTATLCSSCHSRETYSFSSVHPRHTNEGYDCSRCHDFSKAP